VIDPFLALLLCVVAGAIGWALRGIHEQDSWADLLGVDRRTADERAARQALARLWEEHRDDPAS